MSIVSLNKNSYKTSYENETSKFLIAQLISLVNEIVFISEISDEQYDNMVMDLKADLSVLWQRVTIICALFGKYSVIKDKSAVDVNELKKFKESRVIEKNSSLIFFN